MSIQYGIVCRFNEASLWGAIVHTVDGMNTRDIEMIQALDAALVAATDSRTESAFTALMDHCIREGGVVDIDFHSTSFHSMPSRLPRIGDEVEVVLNDEGRHFAIHLITVEQFKQRVEKYNAVTPR